jgi:hypothetical protein
MPGQVIGIADLPGMALHARVAGLPGFHTVLYRTAK